MLNFKINQSDIEKIGKFTKKEKDIRLKNLESFNKTGFPNNKSEDWKFSDLSAIISKNFEKLDLNQNFENKQKIELIKDFDHNYIITVNGELNESNFDFEDISKIKIESCSNLTSTSLKQTNDNNPLVFLNKALSNKGYSLQVSKGYKFKKVLVIYKLFTEDLNENILNTINRTLIKEDAELHILELDINKSKKNFFNNTFEYLTMEKSSVLRNISLQSNKSNGYFYKSLRNDMSYGSKYFSFIFPTGLKFNKLDLEFNLLEEHCECNLKAASFLNKEDHQEIKTRINHLAPNCKSFQKVKNVVDSSGKGVYQGKIFVKDVAQKTDAYQLSKAILLEENSEFDSKPELEIYADDVKCSHGSTSGSIDDESVYYLMSRGLNKKESIKLLVNGFLNEIIEDINNPLIKKFIANKLER